MTTQTLSFNTTNMKHFWNSRALKGSSEVHRYEYERKVDDLWGSQITHMDELLDIVGMIHYFKITDIKILYKNKWFIL